MQKELEIESCFQSEDFKAELAIYRKRNYWRGFRACALLIAIVLVVGFVVWANIFISANS